MFVAPSTRTPVSSCPTPFICTRNSVLILLEPSDSDSLRVPASESISSMKIIAGFDSRASSKRFLTNLQKKDQVILQAEVTAERTFPNHLATY